MRSFFAQTAALAAATLIWLVPMSAAEAVEAQRAPFGQTADGGPVEAVTLTNAHGVSARVIAYGAALQSLKVPDRAGRLADVVLAFPDMGGYLKTPKYFGATVGRYANRIANGRFSLDGKTYHLATNDGSNALHGGRRGFDKVVWTVAEVTSGPVASVTFTYTSPDGDEGYPGTLKVSVTYSLDEHDALTTRYKATTDKPTVVNLTNHSFFNLGGAASGRDILDERLAIAADHYNQIDASLIPQGAPRPVAGTPFDFQAPHVIGARIHDGGDAQLILAQGYDHNFVLNKGVTLEPIFAARLEDPISGRVMELDTTQPGVQFYAGNFLNGDAAGKDHYIYRQSDGLALEPQHFPNSPNRPDFPSVQLDPGAVYREVSVYRFSTVQP
jgi:aldose 1-epimerase